ncbi:MAG: 1-deoxy-D-xylulose-5-phosphate synthase [Candidatus Raymondbacteria bacterium RifOxyA12_full_50_37]|uniref:1-deoxy-D-xylulose-5-phosphate synthase n=1 Tax=Candidatus Raymondbacteria bacterium RIFOXYD12_FULL_49_13 TaxID=1817890 RepID=A0A1F7F1Q9_UNCRA|nr:MAG: 1-deoxy-D-xylulose-5-phosphate synthase [Candidatus Raymondbacteria bacterium RifOxyA12_full_50_37]OGJ93961.1 MAG: 1-deoxy-D-xylulose-5-phosphate synthase [Candidatus Raymondbacteria bacterium RIFOXYA2_FULL_49_16]OGJ94727.1 MAG: 1-deoxy-D-xylulose-5-phosphate synthase [Candidatus Raymondbacteria bacterium RifOxyC12_full_50_8]OGJ98331.1 MAG: 1-deoxy-D-xylulose-5-phosphate synthase [Candidatus Raymondbacteria bacterium RIFOXYC2_FULL_50_21]OGK00512.1 MAG: 1-deoxy-D-xylulose-5-phosphate syn
MLENIQTPEDFRNFTFAQLAQLSNEVRDRILSVISETGGHLASSLGAVELTIALHYVYQTPIDKLVWDVGHQCYTHKIITGRNGQFPTIRQHNGLSGFPRTCESPFDVFDVGHASTSISVALGIAKARDTLGEKFHVVSVIGDGSMTGGLAFEGLNNAGALKTNLAVVLNDNKMSISPNVGALSSYLNRILTDPRYNKLKSDIWELTGKLKGVGSGIRNVVGRLDESLKHLVLPGKLFEDLGFRYFGPIDGHNFEEMVPLFRNIRQNISGPVLIHVITKKGKGYKPAEENAPKFHGIGSFETQTGKIKGKRDIPTYSAVFGKTLCALAEKNKAIVGITAAMPAGTGLEKFAELFPDRFFDVGIAESHAVTFAAGFASQGLRPVVALYSTFLQRAFDQIIHDVAIQKLNVVFCIDRGGLTPDDGPTHHGAFDLAYLRCIPNMVIMSPKDENELRHMMWTALRIEGPVAIRYPKGEALGVEQTEPYEEIPVPMPEIVLKGKDVLLLAVGEMVQKALSVAAILKKQGITPTVVNSRFIKPIAHSDILSLTQAHSHIFTLETGTVRGGFGTAVLEAIHGCLSETRKFEMIGFPDGFIQHGEKERIYQELKLTDNNIAEKVINTITI